MDTKKLRQKILDLAIRGKLVPQDPNDEQASVLLERIRAEKERLIKEGKIKRSKKSASDTPHYENIDFDVPSSWEIITLSEVFFMHAGKSISAADISPEPNEEYRYLCVGGNGKRGYVSSYNTVGAHPIIGRQGALCGNVNYTDGQVYATEHAVVVDTFCETEAWWAYYFLKQLNLNQYATATAQPGLSVNTIGDVQIPLPPYKEQVRIVAAIEQWYSLIDALETAKEDLQISIEYTKSKILDLAIHGRLVLQDPNDEPAIELLKRINPKFTPCDNAHYENVPSNWALARVEDIGQLLSGRDLTNDECNSENMGLPYLIGASNIEGDTFSFIRWTEKPQVISQIGDILISCKGTIGTIVKNDIGDMHIARQFMAIRPNTNCITSDYLHICLISAIEEIKKDARGVIPGISRDDILAKVFTIPPLNEQLRIVAAMNLYHRVLDNISANL